MTFSQKLDLLLKLSATSNSVLAHRMRLDPSYISKLRHGSRSLPRNSEHTLNICSFIVSQCTNDFQIKSLCETVNAAANTPSKELAQKVLNWLHDDDDDSSIKTLLNDFSSVPAAPQRYSDISHNNDMQAFYGDDGHLQAYYTLLKLALNSKKPITLLLYSDDESILMSKNSQFSYEWNSILWQIIMNGGKIKVIHKINSDIDEMFDVIRRWLPFFVSGAVESFYYPRLRDGIYKRSLAVIPNVAASFSTSIGQESNIATTFLVQDSRSVDSFANEFYSYASLCKPLVEFYTISSNRFWSLFQDYLNLGYENIIKSDSLPLTTIPKKVFNTIETRINPKNAAMLHRINEVCNNKLLRYSTNSPVSHIFKLSSPEEVLAGNVPISGISMLEGKSICYTADEYCAHLEHLLWMIKNFPWFNVILDRSDPSGFSIHIFERKEVYIFRETYPYIIFRINENNIVAAFYEYLHRMQNKYTSDAANVEKEIQSCLNKLKKL